MKYVLAAFLIFAGCAKANGQEFLANEAGGISNTLSVRGMNGCSSGRRRIANRVGNDTILQVGLFNIIQLAARNGGNVGQSASQGGSGGKGPIRRIFGRRGR